MRLKTLATFCLFSFGASAYGAPVLSGSSGVITLPAGVGPSGTEPGLVPLQTNVGTGTVVTWPASPMGSYSTVGQPSGSSTAISWDFTAVTAVPGNVLPVSSYMRISDLDNGETWSFYGIGPSGILTQHWLTDAIYASYTVTAGDLVQQFMPSWAFDSATGIYTFTGEGASGNPALFVLLQTSQPLRGIEMTRDTASNGVTFSPVPEPATNAMIALGLIALGLSKRSTWNNRT